MESKKVRYLSWVVMTGVVAVASLLIAHFLQRDFGVSLEPGTSGTEWFFRTTIILYMCMVLYQREGAWWQWVLPVVIGFGFASLASISHAAYLVGVLPVSMIIALLEDWRRDFGWKGRFLVFSLCAFGLASIDLAVQYALRLSPVSVGVITFIIWFPTGLCALLIKREHTGK